MGIQLIRVLSLGALLMASAVEVTAAEPARHITGIGGVFFKAKNPKALAAWYRDDLDALLARVRAKGIAVLKRDDKEPNGRCAWIPRATRSSSGSRKLSKSAVVVADLSPEPRRL